LEFSPDLKVWHPLTDLLGGFNGASALWLDASATNAATPLIPELKLET
jgi:hypothetical protein